MSRLRVAIDVGGTFTDLVAYDSDTGALRTEKALTTPSDRALGVMRTLRQANVSGRDIALFLHGSTTVINTITERTGARTALVTTEGFRDILEIGRGTRPDLYNLQFRSPAPFVPRHLRFEARERISTDGTIITSLDEAGVRTLCDVLIRERIEAVAVCFLNAYANPAHELRCSQLLRDALNVPVCASSELSREWREYERTNTTVLNAYVQPVVDLYLGSLQKRLQTMGMTAPAYAMQSNGGTTSFDRARSHPITLVESGPAGGINGAAVIAKTLKIDRLIYIDIGGTTAKCTLVINGETPVTTDYWIERTRTWPGYPIRASVLDIVEIGAGGGSIAWFDKVGMLRVGPRSAGADPGPACYGLGGSEATLTDANLWADRVKETGFAGNQLQMSRQRAAKALAHVAAVMGTDTDQAALDVIRVAEASMIEALKRVTIQRGHDPRDFVLVASGGGGPLHAATLAQELETRAVLIPPQPGIFCAWGMLASTPYQDFATTRLVCANDLSPADLAAMFMTIEEDATNYFCEFLSQSPANLTFERACDLRYSGQEHTVRVPVGPGAKIDEILENFQHAHHLAFTFSLPDSVVEFVSFRVRARAEIERPGLELIGEGVDRAVVSDASRRVLFDGYGRVETPVYARMTLKPNIQLEGPLIVEEPTATTIVRPGQTLKVDRYGILHIELA